MGRTICCILSICSFIAISFTTSGQAYCSFYNKSLDSFICKLQNDTDSDVVYYKYFISDFVLQFDNKDVQSWFSSMIEDDEILHNYFSAKDNNQIISCLFENKDPHAKLEFNNKNKDIELNEMDTFSSHNEVTSKRSYNEAHIAFSKILFSDETALMFFTAIFGINKIKSIWLCEFKKNNNCWEIVKMKGMPTR